jgi:phage I-like protein
MKEIRVFSAFSLQVTGKQEFRIIPAGRFKASDGRPAGGMWSMNGANGAKMVDAAQRRQSDYVIDYEHQTMLSNTNGKPAPAAGWFKQLAWRDDGLYVIDARWTVAAKTMLDAEQYRYVSPVFAFDSKTFEIGELINIALTNEPALHGLTDLASLNSQGGQALGTPSDAITIADVIRSMNLTTEQFMAASNSPHQELIDIDRSKEALEKFAQLTGIKP